MTSQPRGLLALALFAAALSALRYAPTIDDPWSRSTGSVNASTYYGRIEQNYRRYGFGELKGAPYLYKAPVAPGAIPSALESFAYLRHPVLSFWLLHAVVDAAGWSERTFRLMPIAFSSATGALLVLLVGRCAGAGWALPGAPRRKSAQSPAWFAVAALALYLTLPMSWYSGANVSYEPITLAFILGAFLLHVRLRQSGAGPWLVTWVAVFLAGQIDWIGLAVVPAICVFELTVPREEGRRLGRALLLGVPALASALTHILLVAWWKGSFDAAISFLVSTARYSMKPAEKGSFAQWLANQAGFWRSLYTLPVAIIAAAALPWILIRLRSATDGLSRAAIALLVPAVLHVVLFRDHSFDHDFWWAYAIPYAVLAVIIVLRDATAKLPARARAWVAGAVVIALAVVGALSSRERYLATRTDEYRDVGRDFNELAGKNDALMFVDDLGLASFYVHAWFPWGGQALAATAAFRDLATLKHDGALKVDRLVVVVPTNVSPEFVPENRERLERIGELRLLDVPEFARRLPAIAKLWSGHGLWILTIR